MKWFHYQGFGGDLWGFRDILVSEDALTDSKPEDLFISPYCNKVTLKGTYKLDFLDGNENSLPELFG